jgi:hypothetical protein
VGGEIHLGGPLARMSFDGMDDCNRVLDRSSSRLRRGPRTALRAYRNQSKLLPASPRFEPWCQSGSCWLAAMVDSIAPHRPATCPVHRQR